MQVRTNKDKRIVLHWCYNPTPYIFNGVAVPAGYNIAVSEPGRPMHYIATGYQDKSESFWEWIRLKRTYTQGDGYVLESLS